MPEQDDANFLMRWSRRKRAARSEPQHRPPAEPPSSQMPEDIVAAPAEPPADALSEPATAPDQPSPETIPEDLVGVEIESMDFDSDFKRFMDSDVPQALRRRALRQLWRSNPVLANVDGLNDYDDDFTDAALAVKVLETVHKVGRGYLDNVEDNDDDVPDHNDQNQPDASGEPETVIARTDNAPPPEALDEGDAEVLDEDKDNDDENGTPPHA